MNPASWVLASGNPGKISEFRALLAPRGIQIVPQGELGIADADEPFHSFVENALAKARHASAACGLPAIADDSGICVPALGGEPGVRSARYALDAWPAGQPVPVVRSAIDAANNRRLGERIAALPKAAAPVQCLYVCVIVLVHGPRDSLPLIAQGVWAGRWTDPARGAGGFGYDPHVIPLGDQRTVAELPAAEKNGISHRAKALARLLEQLDGAG